LKNRSVDMRECCVNGVGYPAVSESSSDYQRLTSDFTISSFATTRREEFELASIRDLVAAIRQREGVEAAVVLGRDGLLIDGQAVPGIDPERVAALIPPIIGPADELGTNVRRAELLTAVLEYRGGVAIISAMSSEAILFVLLTPQANIGQLLFELRRNRDNIAALV
jgi:predicted regulator of Ras-like GTPase activity (Roadblock/LC7/MglB family)